MREAETQAEGEAGSMQGAQCGTRSQVSRIRPWAAGSAKPLSHPGCLQWKFFLKSDEGRDIIGLLVVEYNIKSQSLINPIWSKFRKECTALGKLGMLNVI